MTKITIARLEELKRRAQERAPRDESWRYLEIEEGKTLTDEQRATLKHNLEAAGNGSGWRYILITYYGERSEAPEDLNESLDELNELGLLDQIEVFEDGQMH
jgi:hypothetical protein